MRHLLIVLILSSSSLHAQNSITIIDTTLTSPLGGMVKVKETITFGYIDFISDTTKGIAPIIEIKGAKITVELSDETSTIKQSIYVDNNGKEMFTERFKRGKLDHFVPTTESQ